MIRASDSEASPALKEHVVDAEAAGRRLDQWLASVEGALSRSRIQALIREGAVALDGNTVLEPKQRVHESQRVRIVMPEPAPAQPAGQDIALDVLFEDDQLLVIDKPAGLVVHPGAGNREGTLVNALIHHCGDTLSGIGGVKRPGIVHRLDKDTSGVMVVAKTDFAHQALSAAFAGHGREAPLERAYLALVWGAPARMTGMIEAHLGRDRADRTKRAVVSAGHPDARHAVTHFTVKERLPNAENPLAALVECRLETGRTHQIRVHMAHIGHPLIGDPDYGKAFRTKANKLAEPAGALVRVFPRQALHAYLLAFDHPISGKWMRFEAALPADMAELRAALAH